LGAAGAQAVEVEEVAEDDRRAVTRHAREDDRVVREVRELPRLALGQALLPEVERAGLAADVVEAAAGRLPQRPARAARGVEQLPEGLAVVQPDLAGLRAVVALAPPRRAFAAEEQLAAVRRQAGVLAVVVEEELLGVAALAADAEEAVGVPPEVVAA